MSATLVSNTIKVGQVNLVGELFEVHVSANAREGATPRPFILQDDKQRFLNKDAKELFNSEFINTDKVLYLENLSRVAETPVQVTHVEDSVVVDVPDTAITEDVVEALQDAGVKTTEELSAIDEVVAPEPTVVPEPVVAEGNTKVHVVSEHTSTPFDLTKVFDQAIIESGLNLPQEFLFINKFDRASEYGGDVDAYLAAGGKKTARFRWEVLHGTEGNLESATRIEGTKLWYKFENALKEGRGIYADLPAFRYRNNKVVRVKK